MTQVIREEYGGDVAGKAILGFENLVSTLGHDTLQIIHKLVDLAKTNPLWGGILGIIIIDILGHFGTHKELYCDDCNFIVDFWQWLTGHHESHKYHLVEVPGFVSASAVVQVSVMILTAYGIAEAGSIIADITNLTHINGTSADAASIVKPSVTTLFESNSGAQKVTENVPAG